MEETKGTMNPWDATDAMNAAMGEIIGVADALYICAEAMESGSARVTYRLLDLMRSDLISAVEKLMEAREAYCSLPFPDPDKLGM